jgi:hypothetical protein
VLVVLASAPWRQVVWGAVGGALLLLLTLPEPSAPLLAMGLAGLAASAAFVLDEPAAAAVDAAPRGQFWRSTTRALLLVIPLAAGAAVLLVVGTLRDGGLSEGGLLALGGLVAVAVAVAAVARRTRPAPGEWAGSAVALVAVALGLIEPFARWVVLLPDGPASVRAAAVWAALVVLSLGTVAWATRDPLARVRRTTG